MKAQEYYQYFDHLNIFFRGLIHYVFLEYEKLFKNRMSLHCSFHYFILMYPFLGKYINPRLTKRFFVTRQTKGGCNNPLPGFSLMNLL